MRVSHPDQGKSKEPDMTIPQSARRAVVLLVAVTAVAAGCGGGGDDARTPESQTPLESTLDPRTANTTSPQVSTPSNSPPG